MGFRPLTDKEREDIESSLRKAERDVQPVAKVKEPVAPAPEAQEETSEPASGEAATAAPVKTSFKKKSS